MTLLLWCVCGAFLNHMFECNFLTMLLKPNYEKPVDSAQDVLERGLTVLSYPGAESLREGRLNSHSSVTRKMAEVTYVPKVIKL